MSCPFASRNRNTYSGSSCGSSRRILTPEEVIQKCRTEHRICQRCGCVIYPASIPMTPTDTISTAQQFYSCGETTPTYIPYYDSCCPGRLYLQDNRNSFWPAFAHPRWLTSDQLYNCGC